MQNNSIFGVNLLLFPVKTKTEKKNNPCVIHAVPLVPQRSLRGCSSSRNKCICLSQGLTSPRSTLRGESLVKTQENLTKSVVTMAAQAHGSGSGNNYLSSSLHPGNLWAGGVPSGIGPLFSTWLHLPARDTLGGLRKRYSGLTVHEALF